MNNPLIVNCSFVEACDSAPAVAPVAHVSGTKRRSSGKSLDAVVGGIFGGIAALALVVGIVWVICTRKRRARSRIIKAIGKAGKHFIIASSMTVRPLPILWFGVLAVAA